MSVERGLIIRSPHVEKVLDGEKTWEIRGSKTNIRGRIALIRSGSGTIVGYCDLVGCVGPLDLEEYRQHADRHCNPADKLPYQKTYAWVLANVKSLDGPIPYRHKQGSIIWVRLESHDEQ